MTWGSTTALNGFIRVGPVRGLPACLVAMIVLLLGAATAAAPPASAQPAPPLPKAYVLVDVDTGAVIAQQDARTVRPPASTIKLLTGLIASQRLGPGDPIPISPVAEGMPARKINVKTPQVWAYDHLMYSMMMVSANDAAVALAEKIGGGTLDGYVAIANETAARLGLTDNDRASPTRVAHRCRQSSRRRGARRRVREQGGCTHQPA